MDVKYRKLSFFLEIPNFSNSLENIFRMRKIPIFLQIGPTLTLYQSRRIMGDKNFVQHKSYMS